MQTSEHGKYLCGCALVEAPERTRRLVPQWTVYRPDCPEHGEMVDWGSVLPGATPTDRSEPS